MSEEQSGDEVQELTADEVAELEKLDDAIAKFEQQKRWSDMIRSILKKADLVRAPEEKVELFRQAGTLYLERSSNQAEAIKCFEQLLDYEPQDAATWLIYPNRQYLPTRVRYLVDFLAERLADNGGAISN